MFLKLLARMIRQEKKRKEKKSYIDEKRRHFVYLRNPKNIFLKFKIP
jgi:hypothetical protein